jgi:hypothetical protein
MAIPAVILAAFLFGVSTPLAKILVGPVHRVVLAGIFYAGSGVGLLLVMMVRGMFAATGMAQIVWPRRADLA